MPPVRRRLRLRSREIVEQLHNDDDSDIEEALDDEMDDLIQVMQDSVVDQEETMEEIVEPVIERGRSRTRGRPRASRGRRGRRPRRGSLSAARSQSIPTAREIDELNGDSKTTETIVMELCEPYLQKWHTTYMDRFFTSPTIIDLLWINGMRAVGTVMGNRRGLPQEWRQQQLEKNEMTFCHRGNMTACKWKDKRDVLMLTTKHAATWSEVTSKVKGAGVVMRQKPDCILDYNRNKIGVDLNDQYVSYYALERKTMKWWKKMFFHLVARAMVNAYVIFNKSRTQRRRKRFSQFLMTCGEDLVESAALDAPVAPRGPHFVGKSSRLVGRHFAEKIPATGKKRVLSRVCKVCADTIKKQTGKRGRKETVFYCPDCSVPLCYHPCFKKFHTLKDYTI
ncbi:transposase IS4 domain-containing protein [Phthorimaea operculella]|nr:transposase IS4 domain-containing protein [Phthorimaea operculella]